MDDKTMAAVKSDTSHQLLSAVMTVVALTILTGVAYPAVITVIAKVMFPFQAEGSLIRKEDTVVGSSLIGQSFTKPEYFWGRLSATSPLAYAADASAGSNFGPQHPGLKAAVEQRLAVLRKYNQTEDHVPVDLVTASASGLDPHISIAAARYQFSRVAARRKIPEDRLMDIVDSCIQDRQWGILGEPVVNVLMLNLRLDEMYPMPTAVDR